MASQSMALHRGWLQQAEQGKPSVIDNARMHFVNAFIVCRRYALMGEAARAAGQPDEAATAKSKRRELLEWWRRKLPERNVEAMLHLSGSRK